MAGRWIWVLGRQNAFYRGQTIPLSDRWEELMGSLLAYPFRPPVLGRIDGAEHDEKRCPTIGIVTEWRVLDASDEANISGVESLFAYVEPAEGYEDAIKRLIYLSPAFELDTWDEVGNPQPFLVRHVAEVSVPFQQIDQPDQRALLEVHMSKAGGRKVYKFSAETEEVEAAVDATTEALDDVEETIDPLVSALASITTTLDELNSRLSALEGAAPADAPAPTQVAMSKPGQAVTLDDVRRMNRASVVADEIFRTRQVTAWSRDALQDEIFASPSLGDKLLRDLPLKATAKPATGVQMARPGAAPAPKGSAHERARALMVTDPSLTYRAAVARIVKEG